MKKISLTAWIIIATVIGIVIGVTAPAFAVNLQFLSNIFIRLIKSIVAPLVFSSLVYGIAKSGSVNTMGRIAAKSMSYFIAATSLALVVGLVMVNVFRPGDGVIVQTAAATALPSAKLTFAETMEKMFSRSIIESMAVGDVLQIVIFSVLFGVACTAMGKKAEPVVHWCESVMEVMFKYTQYVIYLAPIGAGAAIAYTVGKNGLGSLLGLAKLVGTLYLALIVFVVGVLGPVVVIARIPLKRFFDAVWRPFVLAFSTASSEAALPQALERMEKFGVPKHIVNFVLPLGYSFNLDGSTLYLALASVFVAQAAGIELPLSTQIFMMLTLMLTSKGVAAVPRASLVILTATVSSFGLPMEGVNMILGVDAFMDMARTSVNLLGNCLASAVVARWEGVDLDKPQLAEAETRAA
jgi:proton glutamate symport protein